MAESARDRHFFDAGPKRILSLDGGGVRGIISLAFLERIEFLLRERAGNQAICLADCFDLIGGTSTGSIIATGLALGHSVSALIDIYLNLAQHGFQRRRWLGGTLVPKFRGLALERAIREHVGDLTLGSPMLRTGLGIVAKRLDTGSVWVFHNHPRGRFFAPDAGVGSAIPNRDLPLANIIRASTAAPSYFEPEFIEIAQGVRGVFVDGGVSPHLNPSLQLLLLATLEGYGFRWPMGADRLLLVSIGTGVADPDLPEDIPAMPAGLFAVQSLRSMMRDCDNLVQTLLQWLGQSPVLWPIDAEVGDLAHDRAGPEKLLHYVRYDAPLAAGWLRQNAGLELGKKEIAALQAFDQPWLAPRLLEIGRSVAAACVQSAHIPALFHPAPQPAETPRL